MIVIKINKCPFSLLIAISITKESPSKPRPWQAKARISKIESLFSCLLVPLHCTRSRNTRSLLQNLIRSTKGPGKTRFYLKPLVKVNQAIIAWSFCFSKVVPREKPQLSPLLNPRLPEPILIT